jgi:hypothetical protein
MVQPELSYSFLLLHFLPRLLGWVPLFLLLAQAPLLGLAFFSGHIAHVMDGLFAELSSSP